MLVTPVPGRLVRDPETMLELPSEGIGADDDNLHWHRLEADGDVTLAPNPAPAAAAAPTPEPTTEAGS